LDKRIGEASCGEDIRLSSHKKRKRRRRRKKIWWTITQQTGTGVDGVRRGMNERAAITKEGGFLNCVTNERGLKTAPRTLWERGERKEKRGPRLVTRMKPRSGAAYSRKKEKRRKLAYEGGSAR